MFRKYMLSYFIPKRFAGHSKWANIKHTKGEKDAKRNVLFTRLSRQIKVAVTEGGSADPNKNLQLSQMIEQCKRFNMPSATLQSVLKSCQFDKANAKSHTVDIKYVSTHISGKNIMLEPCQKCTFRGPGSCMILCELYTSNLHHTKQIIATLLRKNGAKFLEGGSGFHLFEEKGIIEAENAALSSKPKEEQLELATEHAIESNAEEVKPLEDNVFQFVCSPENFFQSQTLLEKLGYTIMDASVDYTPIKTQSLAPSDFATYSKLMSKLEEMPEVVRLFDNVSAS